jgi:hypothetical protein
MHCAAHILPVQMEKTEGFINERKQSRQQRRVQKQKKREKGKSRHGEYRREDDILPQ